MALNLARGHASRIQRQDLVVEAGKPRLALGYQLRLEAGLPVARNFDLDLAELALQLLGADSVARVAVVMPFRGMLLLSQMRGQLRLQRSLHDGPGQLLQQSVLPDQILWLLVISQQLVDQLLVHLHRDLLSLIRKDRLHKMVYTLLVARFPLSILDHSSL
jgi:hypothetical protein